MMLHASSQDGAQVTYLVQMSSACDQNEYHGPNIGINRQIGGKLDNRMHSPPW